MIAEVVQAAAQEAAKTSGSSTATAIGLGILIVSNVGIWLDKIIGGRLQVAKERRAAEEAEAREAEAKAAEAKAAADAQPKAGGNGNGKAALDLHEKYVLPHSLALERHNLEIAALQEFTKKVEKENREDHGKIFKQLGDIKDLIIGKSAGAA